MVTLFPAAVPHSQPHAVFVLILVGSEEQSFAIQKDFLCHRSDFFRRVCASPAVEDVVKLPNVSIEAFGLVQNFLFTGSVMAEAAPLPTYDSLVAVSSLGDELGIDGLGRRTVEAMEECCRMRGTVPAIPLLLRAWKKSRQGSGLRHLLQYWLAHHLHLSEAQSELAHSLPHKVLSELVVSMNSFGLSSAGGVVPSDSRCHVPAERRLLPSKKVRHRDEARGDETPVWAKRKREAEEAEEKGEEEGAEMEEEEKVPCPRQRVVGGRLSRRAPAKATRRRCSGAVGDPDDGFTTSQKLDFCADLLRRMISGPGILSFSCLSIISPTTHSLRLFLL